MDRLSFRQIAIPSIYILMVGAVLVFAHSGLQGSYGLAAQREAIGHERDLTAELTALRIRNAELGNKVERLNEASLDLDLLDERARAVLGLARQDELVGR